jgi:L-lactate dehydrogenase complex protein LldF
VQPQSHAFKEAAAKGLANADLQRALLKLKNEFRAKRVQAVNRLPEFEALRDEAKALKDHVLANLDFYLERFEANVVARGGRVHWCADAATARETVLAICRQAGVKTVTKGKSMIGEEIAINDHLMANGIRPVETDLGEYIIQLRGEPPSHITAPAVHLVKRQWTETFRASHTTPDLAPDRPLDEPREILDEARAMLRRSFFSAEVGITGANFLIAETGSTVIVTNEGNGDLTQTMAGTHIVLASIEKVVPTLEDAMTLIRVLARSATAQEITSYTTFSTGPRRAADADGPANFHVVLLDNGRSELLGGEFREVLRCIRCGACQSLCPVYGAVGGHAYGWVYAGPIGAVMTPALVGLEEGRHLPEASSFCGACEAVCPMRIPLPALMRKWRERAFVRGLGSPVSRRAYRAWAWAARRPRLYRAGARVAAGVLGALGRRTGRIRALPFARAWTATRDVPAPEGRTFMDQWRAQRGKAR